MGDLGPHALGENLAQTPLASVLVNALKLKVTGELAVRHELGEDRIYFQGGIPTGTQVLRSFKPLGRLLLELGWIDMAAMEKSIEMMGHDKRQGEALVEIGAITREQLDDGLRLLQIRNLVEMARLTEGELEFETGRPPPSWAGGVPPNALRTLRQVLTVEQSLPVCEKLIDRVGGERVPVRVPRHLEPSLEHFDLDDDELAAARQLLEPKTLAAFWESSGLSPPRSCALASELALTGMLVSYGLSEDTGQIGQAAASAERKAAEEARARLTEIMHAAPQASMAKRNRPIEDDRARRRKLLQRAIASNAPTDRLSRAFTGQPKDGAAATTVVVPPSAPLPTPAADGRPLTAEERTLEALINERTELLAGQDYFARLGIPRSAALPQIKAAFVKAVQLFHPDHLPPKLAHLAAKQREIFSAVKEAYDTLADDDRRRDYLASKGRGVRASPTGGRSGGKPPPRDEDAKIAAFRGDSLLAKCDYVAAADAFHAAYQLDANGDYLASELWCTVLDPARKGEAGVAKQKLIEAAAKHPEAVRPSYYLGVIARMEGRTEEAEQLFRNVLRISPKHLEAGQELRLLELRKKRGDKPGSPRR
ncbi:MAG: J domain-containing protein [Myxococcales bacterium]